MNHEAFLVELSLLKAVISAKNEAVSDWGIEVPFSVLYSAIGKSLASAFADFSNEERIFVFRVIESGLKAGDEVLRNAIATGLLEAFYMRAVSIPGCWELASPYFGVKAKVHIDGLVLWHGGARSADH